MEPPTLHHPIAFSDRRNTAFDFRRMSAEKKEKKLKDEKNS
jgi:hypothetical protein